MLLNDPICSYFSGFTMNFLKITLCLLVLALSTTAAAQEPKPLILASIKPLQLIAAAVAGDQADVELLLPVSVSPHLYQLKPSDRQRLAKADMIVWVGPALERFLLKPLALVEPHKALNIYDGVAEHHGHDDHEEGGHAEGDPHSWLDPIEAIAIAHKIAQQLMRVAPSKQPIFQQNAEHFEQRIRQLDKKLQAEFQAIEAKPYIVLHDAYSHFEERYGVKRAAALALSPDRKPGARHIWRIKQLIDKGGVGCIFREPQYKPAILESLIKDADIRIEVLDPLAAAIKLSPNAYELFIADFAETFLRCIH